MALQSKIKTFVWLLLCTMPSLVYGEIPPEVVADWKELRSWGDRGELETIINPTYGQSSKVARERHIYRVSGQMRLQEERKLVGNCAPYYAKAAIANDFGYFGIMQLFCTKGW
jgi:hypothetical protein